MRNTEEVALRLADEFYEFVMANIDQDLDIHQTSSKFSVDLLRAPKRAPKRPAKEPVND